eukprot:scaffold15896_cov60-Cyclotella_meneghiniana.AAC.3
MPRLTVLTAVALVSAANAFTAPQSNLQRRTTLFSEDEPGNFVERGVSMDQDGKSNVWAIEPKMEIENKSSEEKTGGIIGGLAALGVFGVIAAGVLTNLPDPDQF